MGIELQNIYKLYLETQIISVEKCKVRRIRFFIHLSPPRRLEYIRSARFRFRACRENRVQEFKGKIERISSSVKANDLPEKNSVWTLSGRYIALARFSLDRVIPGWPFFSLGRDACKKKGKRRERTCEHATSRRESPPVPNQSPAGRLRNPFRWVASANPPGGRRLQKWLREKGPRVRF